jgi:hypothetical protein
VQTKATGILKPDMEEIKIQIQVKICTSHQELVIHIGTQEEARKLEVLVIKATMSCA